MASVIGFAILIMFGWHLYSIGQGQTSVETHDNDQYRKIAMSRGKVRILAPVCHHRVFTPLKEFVNSYDLG